MARRHRHAAPRGRGAPPRGSGICAFVLENSPIARLPIPSRRLASRIAPLSSPAAPVPRILSEGATDRRRQHRSGPRGRGPRRAGARPGRASCAAAGAGGGGAPSTTSARPRSACSRPTSAATTATAAGPPGDAIDWMREQEGAGELLRGDRAARRALRHPGAVRGGVARRRRRAARRSSAGGRCWSGRRPSTPSTSGGPTRPRRRASTSPGAASTRTLVRRFRIGYAPGRRRGPRGARDPGGLLPRGAGRRRARAAARRPGRGLLRLADHVPDRRQPGAGAGVRRAHPRPRRAGEVRQLARGRPLQEAHACCSASAEARGAAARAKFFVVAEGYTDVMGLVAAGVESAVACMGTSLTTEQLTPPAALGAGGQAVLRRGRAPASRRRGGRVEAAEGVNLSLSAVALPSGRDPGDLAGDEEGREALARAVDDSEPLVTSLIRSRVSRAGRSPRDREEALEDIARLLRRFPTTRWRRTRGFAWPQACFSCPRGWRNGSGSRRARTRPGTAVLPPRASAAAGGARAPLPRDGRRAARGRRHVSGEPAARRLRGGGAPAGVRAAARRRRRPRRLARGPRRASPSPCGSSSPSAEVSEAELREAAYRVELPMLRAPRRRAAGRGRRGRAGCETLELARRVRAALRGDS